MIVAFRAPHKLTFTLYYLYITFSSISCMTEAPSAGLMVVPVKIQNYLSRKDIRKATDTQFGKLVLHINKLTV